jgi:hypothetical protein
MFRTFYRNACLRLPEKMSIECQLSFSIRWSIFIFHGNRGASNAKRFGICRPRTIKSNSSSDLWSVERCYGKNQVFPLLTYKCLVTRPSISFLELSDAMLSAVSPVHSARHNCI